jgi:serine/threonine protein kinase
MQCSSCNRENEAGRSFCAECGTALPIDCPACGVRNAGDVKFCGSCGAALPVPRRSMGASVTQPSAQNFTSPESFVDARYKVIKLVGEGSSKTVYLAHDNKIDRDVAFSLIKTAGLDAAGRERISREARAMGKLGDNPYIVGIYDVGEERGQPYIVSQYMAGGSVDDLLRRSPNHRVAPADAMRIACDVCRALEYAHSRGIIHRDIKPANVWLTADGTTKLGDFGLAIARDRSRLTAAGMIVGTPAYMPPEQALGKPLDARSDLYSLGAMLCEMITGQPPFRGDDLLSVIAQHINAVPDAPSKSVVGIAPALDALVMKLLAKNPDERPRDAAAARGALEAMITPIGTTIDDVAASVVMERPDLQRHAAPDGTVSILFSDIENSTMMTERLGDLRAQELLHEHNDLIRKQVAEQKGFEVKSMGDGFMVAFSSARRALLCAIGIQRAFDEYSRQHPSEPIRVRIGLHMGEAISEGGDFFGKTVIMAARIGAKANAGEILVSSVFKAVTESAGDLQFDDGYEVELKGLSGSYHVHRAMWSKDGIGIAAASLPSQSSEAIRSTATAPARRTLESPAAVVAPAGGNRWLLPAGLGGLLLIGGFAAYRLIPHGESTSSAPAAPVAAPSVASQPAPVVAANQVVAPPAPQTTQPAAPPAAQPTQMVVASAPSPVLTVPPPQRIDTLRDTPHVMIIAPGISGERLHEAHKTVSEWLDLHDQGRYMKAWDRSTFLLPRGAWVREQNMIYERRGAVVSRRLGAEELRPGRNPERMLFRYKTRFEKGPLANELVFTAPQPDGKWVITGYLVRDEGDQTALP